MKEWEDNLRVCPRCDHHDRIGPAARFDLLFDGARYELLPAPEVREDPLRFRDSKRYVDRLKTARATTDERDALLNARGKVDGNPVIVGVQDFAFMGGSMGIAVGAAFIAGVRAAIAGRCPYVCSPRPAGRGCRKAFCRSCKCRARPVRCRAQGLRPALYCRADRPDDGRRDGS